MYSLRTDEGHLFGKVSSDIAMRMIRSINGFHRPYKVEGKPEKICYEFSENTEYGLNHDGSKFSFFVFKGYLIIPE